MAAGIHLLAVEHTMDPKRLTPRPGCWIDRGHLHPARDESLYLVDVEALVQPVHQQCLPGIALRPDLADLGRRDVVGGQDLVEKVQEGWTGFDVAISTPDMMKSVGQLGRVLGPQGKMPNPKVGTVTDDVEKAVTESKAGKIEYRTDRQAIVHLAIGKASFDQQKLLDNCLAVIDEVVRAKPSSSKGKYVLSATLTTTISSAAGA